MTRAEHLAAIRAKCRANIALAKERTPGKWGDDTAGVFAGGIDDPIVPRKVARGNRAFIAACAGAAEAGWQSTIDAIDACQPITDENMPLVQSIIAAWEELL